MAKVETRVAGEPAWFDLMTPDLEGAQKFYGALFGWTFDVGAPEMGYYTMCKLGGANAAGMGKRPPDAPYPTAWSVYFKSDDVNASAEAVRANGGQVMMPPMQVADKGHMLVCMDPTGATFGFWQYGTHTGAEVAGEPGAMAWTEVGTRDAEKARVFYAKVLDAEIPKMEGMDYWMLQKKGSTPMAGVMHMGKDFPPEIPPHWMAYFAVPDADASCKVVTENGGQVKHGPFDTPYGRIAVVADPYGAVFSIIKLAMPG